MDGIQGGKMMNKLCLIVINIFFLLTNCSNIKNEQNEEIINKTENISDLVYMTYESRDESSFQKACNLLNDVIISDKTNYWITISNDLDTIKKEIRYKFDKQVYETFPHIGNRYLLEICVKDENTVLVEAEPVKISDIRNLSKEYIFDPNNKDENLEKRKKAVEYFGYVNVNKVVVQLFSDVKAKKGLSVDEWRLYFKCLHEIFLVFDDMRNELAIKKWNKNYDSLPFEKRVALSKMIPYGIILSFDLDCDTISLPPPQDSIPIF